VYQIGLKLLDKTDSDTVVDSQGKIVDDLWAQLIKLEIDNIDITNKIDLISTYSDNHGNPVKTYGFLGFNNEYLLHLQTPGFYFIRNLNSIQHDDFSKWYQLFNE
jgi:hypothetical protein